MCLLSFRERKLESEVGVFSLEVTSFYQYALERMHTTSKFSKTVKHMNKSVDGRMTSVLR